MAASERIRFFTQSNGGKNKVVISEASISGCSHFCQMWSECEANWNKQIFNDYMLQELIEVSFFAIQAKFHFTETNFTEAKFDKDPSYNKKQFVQKTSINKIVLFNSCRICHCINTIYFFWIFFLLLQPFDIRRMNFISF